MYDIPKTYYYHKKDTKIIILYTYMLKVINRKKWHVYELV